MHRTLTNLHYASCHTGRSPANCFWRVRCPPSRYSINRKHTHCCRPACHSPLRQCMESLVPGLRLGGQIESSLQGSRGAWRWCVFSQGHPAKHDAPEKHPACHIVPDVAAALLLLAAAATAKRHIAAHLHRMPSLRLVFLVPLQALWHQSLSAESGKHHRVYACIIQCLIAIVLLHC